MANNPYRDLPQPQARVPGHWAGYMLGACRTPPPPRPQDYAVAMMNRVLDGGQIHQEEEEGPNYENIDPQLRVQPLQARPPTGELLYYQTFR
jgi:hypothetical protein